MLVLSVEIRTSGVTELSGEGWIWRCRWEISDPAREADCSDYIIKDASTSEPKPLAVRSTRNNRDPLIKLRSFYS